MRVRLRLKHLLALAPIAGAALLGVGCAQILGLGDYTDGEGPAAKCSEGTADCDENHEDCETDTTRDKGNCGGCGKPCSDKNAKEAVCQDGQCVLSCADGFGDCDDDGSNGCETNLSTDGDNCGQCKKACALVNAMTAVCTDGKCALDCDAHWGNCDGDGANGCEQDLNIHKSDCGACGEVCSDDDASAAACVDGTCNLTCNAGHDDCNKLGSDGCEADLSTDLDNCGGCGKACAAISATPSCSGGICTLTCIGGKLDCDLDGSNGCEADPGTDPLNCGTCGHVCEGACGFVCKPVTLAMGLSPGPAEVVVGPTFAYYPFAGGIAKVPIQGGAATQMTSSQGTPKALAMSDVALYWFDPINGYLFKTALPNGGAAISISFVEDVTAMAADAAGVFWLDNISKEVRKLNGVSYTTVATVPGEVFGRIAIDANNVYFTTTTSFGVWSVPRAGGVADKFVKIPPEIPSTLALDATNLYFGSSAGKIYTVGKDGTGFVMLHFVPNEPTNLATDGVDLFWTDVTGGQLLKASVTGAGGVPLLTGNQDLPTGLALDAAKVYWTNVGSAPSTGAVLKLEKSP